MLVDVSNLFDDLFGANPDQPFMHEGDASFTYGDYRTHALKLGTAVLARGLSTGDRLVAQMDKSADGFALWLGCLAVGVVYVPTNTAYTVDEISYFCSNAGASILVADDPVNVADVDVTTVAIADLVAEAGSADPAAIADVGDSTPAALVYTSGTTGRPKGATLTHGCLRDNAQALANVWQMESGDLLVHALPIFHVHGLFIALHPTMLVGARVNFLRRFDVDAVISALDGGTVFMACPPTITACLAMTALRPMRVPRCDCSLRVRRP